MDGRLEFERRLEFDATTDSVDDILAALRTHGVAKVANAYDKALVASVGEAAWKIYKARDFAAAMGTLDPGLQDLHGNLRSIALTDLGVPQGTMPDIMVTSLAREIAERFMDKPVTVHQWSYARCARANHNVLQLPFHQDMRLLGVPLMNVWIPLSACGVEIPGLEVVTQPLPDLLDTINQGENFYAGLGVEIAAEQILAKFGGDSLWHPAFEAGDALFFQGTTIHRTHVTAQMHRDRVSIDMRLV